ncbi:MAG: formylglycine-generating enzyme family protein [Deltaproteobacteria bacterium]|nr:formylglycine-generating enzyme family protein [Deltaproteobacteria bacterium]
MKRWFATLAVAVFGLPVLMSCETNRNEVLQRGYAPGIRCADRDALTPSFAYANMGVRCAKDLPAAPKNDQAVSCGGMQCPPLQGYQVGCNAQEHCEYTNADASGWRQRDVWIFLPPGTFQMGGRDVEGGPANERPVHEVAFAKGYLISRYEGTVAQYEACEDSGDCSAPSVSDWDGEGFGVNRSAAGRGDHPQNGLKWNQAQAFCKWMGGRLPSEAEWEYAAAGPTRRTYPWGSAPVPDCDRAVFNEAGTISGYGCGSGGTMAVGSVPAGASFCGAMDMAGNVWEWTADYWHDSYNGAPTDGSAWITGCETPYRVRRGGGFSGADGESDSDAGAFDVIPEACMGGDASTGLKLTGAPCETDDECFGGLCLTKEFLGSFGLAYEVPGGACSKLPCVDNAECGEGGFCFDTTPFSGMPLSLCLPACEDFSDCRYSEGYQCYSDPLLPDASACLPGAIVVAIKCDDGVCDDNEKANPDLCVDGCGCGDGVCDQWDNAETCIKDCP